MKKKVKKPARKQEQKHRPKPGEYWACVNGAIVEISDVLGKPNVQTIFGRIVSDFARAESGLGFKGGIPMAWDSETMNFKYSGGLRATGDVVHQYKLHHRVEESKIKVVPEPETSLIGYQCQATTDNGSTVILYCESLGSHGHHDALNGEMYHDTSGVVPKGTGMTWVYHPMTGFWGLSVIKSGVNVRKLSAYDLKINQNPTPEPNPEPKPKIQLTVGSDWKCRNGKRVSIVHVGRTYAIGIVRDGVGGVLESGFGFNYYMDGKSDSTPRDFEITGPWVEEVDFDWSVAPKWCNYLTLSSSGKWWLHSRRPTMSMLSSGCWALEYESSLVPPEYAPKWKGDWTKSLTVRPGYKEEK